MSEIERTVIGGRRAGDGWVQLSVFTNDLLAMTVETHGGRASTLLLTREQIEQLQTALAELGEHINRRDETPKDQPGAPWDGVERRASRT